jgi:hypothetical protein
MGFFAALKLVPVLFKNKLNFFNLKGPSLKSMTHFRKHQKRIENRRKIKSTGSNLNAAIFFRIRIAIYGVCFLNGIFNENAIRKIYIGSKGERQPVEIKFEPFDVTFYGNLMNVGGFMMRKHPFGADKFHFSEVNLHFYSHGLLLGELICHNFHNESSQSSYVLTSLL